MKAIRVDEAGGPETLRLVELEEPVAGEGEIVVRVAASGVNFADIMCRRGVHPGMPSPPLVPGCEGSGVVTRVGGAVRRFTVGERVAFYSPPGGSYAELAAVPESHVLAMPETMSFEDAAAFTHVFLTAYHALVTLGRAQPGEWILVTAAAGGVGTAVLQLARELELNVLAGVGSSQKIPVVEPLGVRGVVDYTSSSLAAFVASQTAGRGVDLALESVGGDLFDEAIKALAPLGRIVLYGIAGGRPKAVSPEDLLPRSLTYAALNLSVLFANAPDRIDASWRYLIELYELGKLRPVIRERFPLEKAAVAHRRMESRESTGKIILTLESG